MSMSFETCEKLTRELYPFQVEYERPHGVERENTEAYKWCVEELGPPAWTRFGGGAFETDRQWNVLLPGKSKRRIMRFFFLNERTAFEFKMRWC